MSVPGLNFSRLSIPPGSSGAGGPNPSAEPTAARYRKSSATSGSAHSHRAAPSGGGTPLTSPRQGVVYSTAAPGAPGQQSLSLTRRAADLAGVLDFDVTRCTDVQVLQWKVVETAERLVRAERWYEERLRENSSYYHHRLAQLSRYIAAVEQTSSAPHRINYAVTGSGAGAGGGSGSSRGGSAGKRSTSLVSRQLAAGRDGAGGRGAQDPLSGSGISRGPAPGGVTAASRRQTTPHAGRSASPAAAAAATTATSRSFTLMIQNILSRDQSDAQGERDRRRRQPTTGAEGGSASKSPGRHAVSRIHPHPLRASSGSQLTTPSRQAPPPQRASPQPRRRHSIGSSHSAISHGSRKSGSEGSTASGRRRKVATPLRTSGRRRLSIGTVHRRPSGQKSGGSSRESDAAQVGSSGWFEEGTDGATETATTVSGRADDGTPQPPSNSSSSHGKVNQAGAGGGPAVVRKIWLDLNTDSSNNNSTGPNEKAYCNNAADVTEERSSTPLRRRR